MYAQHLFAMTDALSGVLVLVALVAALAVWAATDPGPDAGQFPIKKT
jgi:hypothetical protein